jgi:surfeit locus 1 family protein
MFSRKWLLATVLVVIVAVVFVRLGFWQLDRLEQRRTFNRRITAQMEAEPLVLDAGGVKENLFEMEFRQVIVKGEYDFSQQIALRNQFIDGNIGVHLVTPLKIEGADQTVMVDRGWVPLEDETPENWGKYDEPGMVIVHGIIRRSQETPELNMLPDPTLAAGQERLDVWSMVNLDRISDQVSLPMVNIFIQQNPDESWTGMPLRNPTEVEITEGPHMDYALQWFSFALLVLVGYPYYVRKTMRDEAHLEEESKNKDE